MSKLRIRRPDDFHRHMRQDNLLSVTTRYVGPYGRILAMPNTIPCKQRGDQAIEYAQSIINLCRQVVEVVPCIKLLPTTTPATISNAANLGVKAVKFYPEGMTTNSEDGMSCDGLLDRPDLLERLQTKNMLLLCHGEHDRAEYCLDREHDFLSVVIQIVNAYPKLRVVLEHITTKAAVEFVTRQPETVGATITPHHLRINLNDVIGDKLEPHNFCKPIAKSPTDQRALIAAATSGNPKFFLGTDDAPHLKINKECAAGCAGVWTGRHSMGHYTTVFEERDALRNLEGFSSIHGARFYGLEPNEDTILLERKPFTLPQEIEGIVLFMAGKILPWQVVE